MPDSDWLPVALIAVALIACAVIAWGVVYQPSCRDILGLLNEDQERIEKRDHEATVTCERDCQISFNFGLVPDEEGADPNEERYGECNTVAKQDLIAQSVMAHWAKISAILAMVGLLGLLWTLRETRRIGQAQVRAYLSVSQIDLSTMLGSSYLLNFHILNCGASPARQVEINAVCELFIRETMMPQTTGLDTQGEKKIVIKLNSVAAQATEKRADTTPDFTPEIDQQLTTNNGVDVEVRGRIVWKDVFGRGDGEDFTFSLMDVGWWMLEKHDNAGKAIGYQPVEMSPEALRRP